MRKIHPDLPAYERRICSHQALQRRGAPDIANSLMFLASDAAGFVTGQTLNVDGGWWMIEAARPVAPPPPASPIKGGADQAEARSCRTRGTNTSP